MAYAQQVNESRNSTAVSNAEPAEALDLFEELKQANSEHKNRPVALAVPENGTGRVIEAFAPFLLAGRRLYCIDGGNVFNPYRLAAWCRREGRDPAELLQRIWISRAYTCHQLATAVEGMLTPLACEAEPPLAAILGIEQLFLDEDLPLFERNHLFEKILTKAEQLRREGLLILITTEAEEESAGNPWARRLAKTAVVLGNEGKKEKSVGRISGSIPDPISTPTPTPTPTRLTLNARS